MSYINVFFITEDRKIFIQAKYTMTFGELVFKYLEKRCISDKVPLQYLFNNDSIEPNSIKTLSELKIIDGSTIDVVELNKLKGALFLK